MLRILLATLALTWALLLQPTQATAGYMWKGDGVTVRNVCYTSDMTTGLADIYAAEGAAAGNVAWLEAVELGLCAKLEEKMHANLGDMLGVWRIVGDPGLEAWEVVYLDGRVVYAVFRLGLGRRQTPYPPSWSI